MLGASPKEQEDRIGAGIFKKVNGHSGIINLEIHMVSTFYSISAKLHYIQYSLSLPLPC